MAMNNRDAKRMGLIDRWQVTIGDDGGRDDRARDDGARDDGARDDRAKDDRAKDDRARDDRAKDDGARVERWYTAHSKASSGRMCEG
jgi:hypothetical protein